MKTHVWIGRQVLAEVQRTGAVELAGKSYAIPAHVANALRSNPGAYLMGHLGPDAFPDPIVGQTTTHPGVERGWGTDGWLRHLLKSASTPEELAFAYGFAGHAAGDVFAHTYVNAYAGSIFVLTDQDSGRQVERRHFVLEKYIDSKMPATSLEGLATATSFARDRLIFDEDAFKQYGKVDTAHHLRAMRLVRESVRNVDREANSVIAQITTWGAEYFKKQAQFTIDAATAKQVLDAAQALLDLQRKELEIRIAAHEFAKQRLSEARDIVNRNPQLITASQTLLIAQTKVAADAVAEAARIASEVERAVSDLEKALTGWQDELGNLVCNVIGGVLPACKDLKDKINNARDAISGTKERRRIAEETARAANAARDATKQTLDNLQRQLDQAVRGLADKSYEAAIASSEAAIKAQRELINGSQKAVDEARKVQEAIAKELGKITAIVDEIKKVIDRYNAVSLLTAKWLSDIDTGAEEFIKASHRAGLMMAAGSGNPAGEFTTWFSCYGQVFVAVPKEVGQAGCLVRNFVEEVHGAVGRAIDGLPELLRWLVFPSREINKKVLREVKPELLSAGKRLAAFITDPTTADFLWLLANQENASRAKLNSVFAEDRSRLKLLTFGDVASMVDRDLGLAGGTVDPSKFTPLRHSVTLAKLALLGPAELNDLIFNLSGVRGSGRYGNPIYRSAEPNYSLLFDAVKSIDGNHQWQAHGLPYPRRVGVAHSSPLSSNYGHDFFADQGMGMRIWVDRYIREKVFLKLFDGPVLGALGERPELGWPRYRFPACPANPFPSTQSDGGRVLDEDRQCADAADPARPVADRPFRDAEEYGKLYFACDSKTEGPRYSTIVASAKSQAAATRRAARLGAEFPDMRFEIHRPAKGSAYWAVMSSRCATLERAREAREVSASRGIAGDAFSVGAGDRGRGLLLGGSRAWHHRA